MSSIEMRRIGRSFGSSRPALSGVDLAIASGERLAVLGPSGSGKSTLLRIIAGLDRPTEGDLVFDGASLIDVPPHRRDVGMVFQNPTLHPHLSVEGNLEFGLKARGTPRAERRRRVREVASMLRLDALLQRRSSTLSGGEMQRAAIGRAVARRPSVLLLDEPFSSLDLPLRSALRRDLLDLHDRYRWTLVHVTHDQAEAMAIGDRIAVLDQGRLVQCDPPRQIYQQPTTPFVAGFVGAPPSNLIPCEIHRDPDSTEWTATFPFGRGTISEASVRTLKAAVNGRRTAIAGVRPEHLVHRTSDTVSPIRPGWLALSAIIHRLEFQGDAVLAVLKSGELRLNAKVAASTTLEEGRTRVFEFELSRVVWFLD